MKAPIVSLSLTSLVSDGLEARVLYVSSVGSLWRCVPVGNTTVGREMARGPSLVHDDTEVKQAACCEFRPTPGLAFDLMFSVCEKNTIL